MSDSLSSRDGSERRRFNINQDQELRDCADTFGVTNDQMKEAVRAAGDGADDVEMHLKGGRSTTNNQRAGGATKG